MIHAANWLATELRHCIVARSTCPASPSDRPTSPSSPVTRDKVLGVSHSISDFENQENAIRNRRLAVFRIPGDVVEPVFSEQESTSAPSPIDETIFSHVRPSRGENTDNTHSEYFNLYSSTSWLTDVTSSNSNLTSKWTRFPPFRFGVEFWDLDLLVEKNRLHSQTIWYAGSLFNVYTLVVRKKDAAAFQLGIYIHRQSSVESVPSMSIPSSSRHRLPLRHSITVPLSGSNRSLTSENSSSNSSLTESNHLLNVNARARLSINADGTGTFSRGASPATSRPVTTTAAPTPSLAQAPVPDQPYRDPRPLISAYFTVSCAGASGTSITKFSSAPDVFGVGQSWGWKTSSFKSEEYLQPGPNGQPKRSLRTTVTLGLV